LTLGDTINRMIEVALTGAKITSASPGHVNNVFLLEEMDHSDLEGEIRSIIEEEIAFAEIEAIKAPDNLTGGDTADAAKLQKEIEAVTEDFSNLKKSPFGDLADITGSQVANLQQFSKNPFQFMLANFLKKFAKGAGIIALATIIFAAVQLIISELLKPGRFLDRRFKRIAADEILLFNSREDVAELRQGFRTVTITTIPFLKGSQLRGQISGNLYNPSAIPMNRLDPRRTVPPIIATQSSSRASRFANRRNSRFG